MKTITEFSGFVLKDAMAKKAAYLTEGKTEEEAQAAINEMLKLDESKGTFYKNVIDMTSSRMDRVKRVVVASKATETEKVPEAYSEREGNFYLVEFYPDPNARAPARTDSRDDRGGRGGRGNDRGRGGSGGRPGGNDRGGSRDGGGGGRGGFNTDNASSSFGGGDRPRREPAPSNIPRPEGAFAARIEGAPAPVYAKKERAPKPPRGPKPPQGERKPRPDRAERAPRGPKGASELRLVLKGQSQSTLQGSGVAETSAQTSTDQNQSTPQA